MRNFIDCVEFAGEVFMNPKFIGTIVALFVCAALAFAALFGSVILTIVGKFFGDPGTGF